jgi:hypothetical protein
MSSRHFKSGDSIVYRKSKQTTHPGRRAQSVRANPKGDQYSYCVDKFWIVRRVRGDGKLIVETRRGKTHVLDPSDPNLRRPTLLQRIRFRDRFAELHRGSTA